MPTPPPWLKPAITAQADQRPGLAGDGPDQRVAVGREGEGAVDDALDPGAAEHRVALEGGVERFGDPVEVVVQQLVAEVPGGAVDRPVHRLCS